MENLKKALLYLGINNFLKEKEKEASSLFTRGLIENGICANENITIVRRFIKKSIDK